MDFVRGATWSRVVNQLLQCRRPPKGTISRIVCHFNPGDAVSTSRNDVDYVVTEFGVASLRGRTLRNVLDALLL